MVNNQKQVFISIRKLMEWKYSYRWWSLTFSGVRKLLIKPTVYAIPELQYILYVQIIQNISKNKSLFKF